MYFLSPCTLVHNLNSTGEATLELSKLLVQNNRIGGSLFLLPCSYREETQPLITQEKLSSLRRNINTYKMKRGNLEYGLTHGTFFHKGRKD